MRKLIHSLQNMRFRTKMILSHFSISLIPLLIFSAVMGNLLVFDAQNTSRSHCAQMVSQMSESIDVYIGTVDKMRLEDIKKMELSCIASGNVK